MNVFWGSILKYVTQIFAGILLQISPTIKAELNDFLTALFRKALATSRKLLRPDPYAVWQRIELEAAH